jgi:hypothetical protein
MNTEIADGLLDERGSHRSCRTSRLLSNGTYLTSTHSSNSLGPHGTASVAIGFSGSSNLASTPPSDGLSDENDVSSRPSRRIKPVSRNLALMLPI